MAPFSADDLNRHAASLRVLARDLLADEALADDAVQQACVTALTRPPAGPVSVGAWLRAIVRSCAIDLWRSERRRHTREQLVVRDEAIEDPDAAELLELQEDIVAAVRSLDEPYRTAVWLRYYEDRTPTTIAQTLDEPVKTVKTRLGRALHQLRHKLDRRYGNRKKWATSLVPLARWSRRTGAFAAAATTGGLLMQGKALMVAAAGVLLLTAGAWWTFASAAAPPIPTQANARPIAAANAEQRAPTDTDDAVEREPAPTAAPTAPAVYGSLLLNVRRQDGSPAANVAIHATVQGEPQSDANELRFVSDAAGVARAERVPAGKVTLSSDRGGTLAAEVTGGARCDVDFMLPHGVLVRGTVRNKAGSPVADADVMMLADHQLDHPVAFAIEGTSSDVRWPRTRSDAAGAFELRGPPTATMHVLAAKQIAFGQFEGVCQTTLVGRADDEREWNPVLAAGKTLRVRVVDADGKPARVGGTLDAYAERPAGSASMLKVFGEEMNGSATGERPPVGLYVFTNCADVPYMVGARLHTPGAETRYVYRRGAIPGGPEVELRLPPQPPASAPGEITGRIADAGNRVAGGALSVSLCARDSGSRKTATREGDRFHVAEVTSGRYFLWVRVGDVPILVGPPFELQPGQKLDLGDVAIQPGGTIRVALRGPGGVALTTAAADLDEGYERHVMKWDGTHLVADNVTVGRHRLNLRTSGWSGPNLDIDVVAGREQLVTVDVVLGALARCHITMPFPDQWSNCEFAMHDASGKVIAKSIEVNANRGFEPTCFYVSLPLGQYTLAALLDGHRRTWPIDWRDPATAASRLRFSLR